MEWQPFILAGLGTLQLIVAGYVRYVQGQMNAIRVDGAAMAKVLTDFQIKVAENYVTHTDLRRIEDALVRIESKIDIKADK